MSRSRRQATSVIIAAAGALITGGAADAASFTWKSPGATGSWDTSPDGTNWAGGVEPTITSLGNDTVLDFSTATGTYTSTNNIGTTLVAPFELNALSIGGSGVATISGGFLKFVGTNPQITRVAGSGTPAISSTVVLDPGVNLLISGTGTNQLNISSSGKVTGGGVITLNGGALVMLSGTSDYSGGTTVNSGELVIFNNTSVSGSTIVSGPLGTGTLLMKGGAIRTNSANARTVYNPLQIEGDIALGNGNSANDITFAGAATINGTATTRTLSVTGIKKFTNSIGDGGAGNGLTIAGSGTLYLGGGAADAAANTYTGVTTVSGATVILDKASNTSAIAGNLLFSSGTLTWNRAHQIADASTLTVGGGTVDVKVNENIGALTVNTGGTFNTDSTASGNTIGVAGATTLTGGALNVNTNSTLNAGSISLTGGTFSSAGTVSVTGTAAHAAAANFTAGSLSASTLNVTANTTTVSAGASVNVGALNVTGGTFTTGGNVTITGAASSASNVNVNSTSFIADSLSLTGGSFKSAGSTVTVNSLSVSGGSNASGTSSHPFAGTLNVGAGGLTITQPTGRSATFGALQMNNGGTPGTLKLSGNVSFIGSGNLADTYTTRITQGAEGYVDLNGGERTFNIADGGAIEDFVITAIVVDGIAGTGGGIRKTGAGTLGLGFRNGFGGDTIVEEGRLMVFNYDSTPSLTGSATGTGNVFVEPGAKLGGNGRISGSVNVDGTVDPARPSSSGSTGVITTPNPAASLTLGSVSFEDGSVLHLDLNDASDKLVVEGLLNLGSGLDTLELSGVPTNVPEEGLILVQFSSINGAFNTVTGVPDGYSLQYTGSSIVLAVPEPGTLAMLPLAGAVALRRRRR